MDQTYARHLAPGEPQFWSVVWHHRQSLLDPTLNAGYYSSKTVLIYGSFWSNGKLVKKAFGGTGCAASPTSTMVSTSIVGCLKTSAGVGIEGATIQLERWTGSAWSSDVPVYQRAGGQTDARVNPVRSAGTSGTGNEINEGGFVFNQLTPDTRYRLVITNGTTQTFTLNGDVALPTGRLIQDITW